jgi:COP9 signalosome complex subunit 8
MRLPNNLATSPLGKQLLSLLASTSERKYANVYSRSQTLLEHVSQSDFFDTSLGAVLGLMIASFLGTSPKYFFVPKYTVHYDV